MTRLFQVRLQALMHKLGEGGVGVWVGGVVLFTSMKQLRTRTWYIFHQTKWFKNPLISVYVIHSSKKIRTLQTKSLLRWYIFIYSVSTHAFTRYKHVGLQSLHFQSGVLIVCRGLRRVVIIIIRLHLLNRGRVDNGHWHDNIIWEAPLHLPVLLTQGTPVHATMHQAWVTWRVLHSARTWVSKI